MNPSAGGGFLSAVTSEARPRIDVPVLIVVAHPDDETLGCGGLLARLDRPTIVHVTDGAPRSGDDAVRLGYETATAYARARRAELTAALALAGIAPSRLACLDVPDQEVVRDLPGIARRLTPYLEEAEVVLTHAYEGGHPDHDATAVAVCAAAVLLGERAPPALSMPFYRADPDGPDWLRQRFGPGEPASVLRLTTDERERKAAMLACFASQAETLRPFGAADEAFRPAGQIDPARPPNGGHVLYDRYGWGVTAAEFAKLAGDALDGLGGGARA